MHHNPVKHGLVLVATQYPYCSAAWFERTATPAQVKTIYSFKTERLNILDDFSPDWVDYWAVDFDYESRPEIIHEPRSVITGEPLPNWQPGDELVEFVPVPQGSFIFENEWQSFRTRKDRNLELISADHTYPKAGRYIVAVKVIDIFGNDTMTLVPVDVK